MLVFFHRSQIIPILQLISSFLSSFQHCVSWINCLHIRTPGSWLVDYRLRCYNPAFQPKDGAGHDTNSSQPFFQLLSCVWIFSRRSKPIPSRSPSAPTFGLLQPTKKSYQPAIFAWAVQLLLSRVWLRAPGRSKLKRVSCPARRTISAQTGTPHSGYDPRC